MVRHHSIDAHVPSISGLLVQKSLLADPTTLMAMSPEAIFVNYVRLIGIGGIAVAGLIGIWKSRKVLIDAITVGLKDMLFNKGEGQEKKKVLRTNRDMKMTTVFGLMALIVLVAFFFFRYSILAHPTIGNPWTLAFIAIIVAFGISFLFTAVAAQAIAIVGINPVSGMTLMT